jgi:hypothetical protein
MKIKQIIMTSLLSFITAMTFIACSDDDSNNDIKIPNVSQLFCIPQALLALWPV